MDGLAYSLHNFQVVGVRRRPPHRRPPEVPRKSLRSNVVVACVKRHPALHPLSRDHHNLLVHARRLRGLDARHDAETSRRRFLSYWPIVALHFDEEERVLAPRIRDEGLRQRLLDEHESLRKRAAMLAATPFDAAAFGEALRLHVRFEEDLLFPHLESTVTDGDWSAVSAEALRWRREHRPASVDDSESCYL